MWRWCFKPFQHNLAREIYDEGSNGICGYRIVMAPGSDTAGTVLMRVWQKCGCYWDGPPANSGTYEDCMLSFVNAVKGLTWPDRYRLSDQTGHQNRCFGLPARNHFRKALFSYYGKCAIKDCHEKFRAAHSLTERHFLSGLQDHAGKALSSGIWLRCCAGWAHTSGCSGDRGGLQEGMPTVWEKRWVPTFCSTISRDLRF